MRADQLIDGIAEITHEPNLTVLVIDASKRQDASLALFAIKPNVSSSLLRTLITSVHSQLEAEQKANRDVAAPAAPPPASCSFPPKAQKGLSAGLGARSCPDNLCRP